jgi:hypothetical protein
MSDLDYEDDDDDDESCEITVSDVDTEIQQLLSNDPVLTHIEFFYQDVSEGAICCLCEALHNNLMVDWLSLEGCDLTTESARAIGQMLRVNRRIRHLVLNENKSMGPEGVVAIMEGLCQNRKLQTIMLERVLSVDLTELEAIGRMLQVNSTLRELSLGKNGFLGDRFRDFARSLTLNQTIVRLELGYCDIPFDDVGYFFGCIRDHSTLAHLDLTCNHLNVQSGDDFSNLLRQNQSLKSISVTDNCLGPHGVAFLALALEENTTLESLVISRNGIGDEGAVALSRSLPKMKGLRDLYLVSNNMTSDGYNALCEGMKENRSLHSLRLGGNKEGVPFLIKKQLRYYERRNKVGWPILESSSLTSALFPILLGKISSEPSMLYFFLTQSPGLITKY